MRMHDPSTKDPIITQPEPLPLFLPVLESTLRGAGVSVHRSVLVERFMGGAPRVAIVYGSPDHPAQVYDAEIARRGIKSLWERGALPFGVAEPAICDGVAQGHEGMSFSLVSRNLTASMLVSQFIAHGYDGAIVLGSCDKRPVGDLAGLIEVDLYRRRVFGKPFPAAFVPANVMPEVHLTRELRQAVLGLRDLVEEDIYRQEIDDLVAMKLKCNTYAMFKKLLDNLAERNRIPSELRDDLEKEISQLSCVKGGTCAFIGTGNTDKFMLAALGVVPSRCDFLREPADAKVMDTAAETVVAAIREKDSARSVSALVKANLNNAIRVWCAIGGSTNWGLHFPYIARLVGKKVTPRQLAKTSAETPHLIEINPLVDKSMFTLADEVARGESSGIDSLMRELFKRNMAEEAATIDGDWKTRTAAALEANNRVLFREARRGTSGIVELKGNLCDSSIVKMTGIPASEVPSYDKKVYLAVAYLGEKEAQEDLFNGRRVLERLLKSVSFDTLYGALLMNFPDRVRKHEMAAGKQALMDTLVKERLLRIMVAVIGEGPRAHGMPELYYPSEYLNRDLDLRHITVLFTDARYSGATYGPCIGHAVPEALEGGGVGALQTGDLVYIDFEKGRINVLDTPEPGNIRKPKAMDKEALLARPELAKRQKEILKRREGIPPSVRPIMETLTSALEGCGAK